MTEVEIHGGPRDGETFDVVGNPESGELVSGLAGVYRVYERNDGTWVGVWTGHGELAEAEPVTRIGGATFAGHRFEDSKPDPSALQILTVAMFSGGLGASLAVGLFLFVPLAWAAEWVAAKAGGWLNLALVFASVLFVFAIAAGFAARRQP